MAQTVQQRLQSAECRMERAWMACTRAERAGQVAEAIKRYDIYLSAYDGWCRIVARGELATAGGRKQ